MKALSYLVTALLIISTFQAFANEAIDIDQPYIKATIPGADNTAAYMRVVNRGSSPIKLLKVSSDVSHRVEIHEHVMANGMMSMAQVSNVVIPANNELLFQPYGYHLMFFGVHSPLIAGESVAITLYFEGQKPIQINYLVRGLPKAGQQHTHHHH